jgi:hypothetical protein
MHETYTRKQAMERLGIRSTNAFLSLAKRYPEGFVIVYPGIPGTRQPHYDRVQVDKFAEQREYLIQIAGHEPV